MSEKAVRRRKRKSYEKKREKKKTIATMRETERANMAVITNM